MSSLNGILFCTTLTCLREVDINNVGSISQALYAKGNPDYDEVISSQIQALQVSTVSIMNCIGRILIGSYYLRHLLILHSRCVAFPRPHRRFYKELSPASTIVLHLHRLHPFPNITSERIYHRRYGSLVESQCTSWPGLRESFWVISDYDD